MLIKLAAFVVEEVSMVCRVDLGGFVVVVNVVAWQCQVSFPAEK